MTAEEREDIEQFLDNCTIRLHTGVAVLACLQERDSALSLARRVYAECGPGLRDYCPSCKSTTLVGRDVICKPDCLWLAAEAVLREAGS